MRSSAPSGPGYAVYRQRSPERACLYQALLGHLETYLALGHEGQGARVPHQVEAEFPRYLQCGIFAHGFARSRCGRSGHDSPVAVSCKARRYAPRATRGA